MAKDLQAIEEQYDLQSMLVPYLQKVTQIFADKQVEVGVTLVITPAYDGTDTMGKMFILSNCDVDAVLGELSDLLVQRREAQGHSIN